MTDKSHAQLQPGNASDDPECTDCGGSGVTCQTERRCSCDAGAKVPEHCPTCNSPDPARHPAVQFEGEVEICRDRWHATRSPEGDDMAREAMAGNEQLRRDLSHAKACTEVWMNRARKAEAHECGVLTHDDAPSRHTVIEQAIRGYCRRQSSAAVQGGRIYYAGLSITDLVNDIEAALAAGDFTHSDLQSAHKRIQELQGENDRLADRAEKASSFLRWGTWMMTPAAQLDWKNQVEEFLSSMVPSAMLGGEK